MGQKMFGGSSPTREILGNKDANLIMQIQYCGGWGYKKHAEAVQREVEKMYPAQFKYIFYKDPGVTGNLEVHIAKAPYPGNPLNQVHSKKSGEGYPHNDWERFHEKLEEVKIKLAKNHWAFNNI